MSNNVNEMLATLGYPANWSEYGLVGLGFLAEQIAEFERGDDQNTEHYRYASFCRILERTEINDLIVDRFVELVQTDPDEVMADAALGLLMKHPGLTTEQLNRLGGHPAFAAPHWQRIYERTRLLRGLDAAELTKEFIDQCISCGDQYVQRKLLERRLTDGQLIAPTDVGSNRAVRNLALTKLRRRS